MNSNADIIDINLTSGPYHSHDCSPIIEKVSFILDNIFVAGGDDRGNASFSGAMDILYYRNVFDSYDFRICLKQIALSFIEGGTSCAKDLHFFVTILKISDIDKNPILKRVKIKLTTALKQ